MVREWGGRGVEMFGGCKHIHPPLEALKKIQVPSQMHEPEALKKIQVPSQMHEIFLLACYKYLMPSRNE